LGLCRLSVDDECKKFKGRPKKTDASMEKTGKKRAQQPRWKQKWKSVVEDSGTHLEEEEVTEAKCGGSCLSMPQPSVKRHGLWAAVFDGSRKFVSDTG
jgi:hypothetical protein